MMIDMPLKEMNTTSRSIKEKFKMLGIDIRESAVHRRLKNASLKYTKSLLKPLLRD